MTADTPLATRAPAPHFRMLFLVLPLFVGSGAAALIYEVVWLQVLQLVIGSTAVSLGVLLATFMAGMCLGSVALPRLVSPRLHPLRVYAMLEAAIAVIGLASVYLIPLLERVYLFGASGWLPSVLLRGVVSVAILLPPTVLMGATLPAVAQWVQRSPQGVSWLGLFYAGNIAGAVLGCLLAGFYLLRLYDTVRATQVAALINLGVAGLSLLLAYFSRHPTSSPTAPLPSTGERGPRIVYLTIALSGLTALGAEVLWTRLLSLTLGATVYTFSMILAVLLFGLGLGSGVGSLWSRNLRRPGLALSFCQLAIAGSLAWAGVALSRSLPYWPVHPSLAISPWHTFQLDLARTLWVILPGALAWGASFPLALATATRDQDPARLVAGVYAANTLGAILGALGVGLLLLPALGTQASQRLLIGVAAASAILAWAHAFPPTGKVLPWVAGGAGVLAMGALFAWTVPPPSCVAVAFGRNSASYISQMAPGVVAEADIPPGGGRFDRHCTYLGEGMNGSVAITKTRSGWRYFHGAGKVQASSDPPDMRLQRLLGHISALNHPTRSPESVLVVALGAGVTAGAFVPYDSVKKLVICDIEPLVAQSIAPTFARENHDVVTDPRTRIVVDDGRHFLRTTREKFDVITSDPIDPWVKGCASLYTVEYFQMCRDRLNPGGVMALWVPLYESNLETSKTLIATFFSVFPNGIIWSNDEAGAGYDVVLFGSLAPLRIDVDELQRWLESHPKVKSSLEGVGFGAAKRIDGHPMTGAGIELLATFASRASDLAPWTAGIELNTDRNLRLQYLAGMWLNTDQRAQTFRQIIRHYRFPENLFTGSPETLAELKRVLARAGRKEQ